MKQILLMIAVVALVGCGKEEEETSQKSESPKAAPEKLITNPIVEKAIRKQLKKPVGKLAEADLEKVGEMYLDDKSLTSVEGLEKCTQLWNLDLNSNQLTDVKGLEKLTKLTYLDLRNNPDLTKAQIAQLQKALPKCVIWQHAK